ncbi:MAG: 50S ribosomal protein L31e [Desulfurococcales archaeon]|nr:50S ribosomal protein L31e [Desulfurococcales archaeon]
MAKDKETLEKAMVYVVPLTRLYWGRRTNRADRAVRLIRNFVKRHTKADRVLIYNEVNNYIWSRGREKPPRRVKILVLLYKTTEEAEEGEEKKELKIAKVKLAPKDAKPGLFKVKSEAKA